MILSTAGAAVPGNAALSLERIDGVAPPGTVEISGVAAGDLRPDWWEAGRLNWVFDARAPLIEPREGAYRNIYAPTIVREEDRWRVFYGAWDGVETGNDRIYTAWTEDFLSFHDRHMVIDHGVYTHVCNCCTIRTPEGWRMMCTAYPHTQGGLNRPAAYESADGLTWSGAAPYQAAFSDLVTMEGYAKWDNADINGMNAILHEDGQYRLYFGDFRSFGKVHRASSTDMRHFTYDGTVLDGPVAVNDVKRIDIAGQPWYLMAAHMNGDTMWYSLSQDGMSFGPRHVLTRNQAPADRYMVAVGWVVDGRRVLGFLYGAGASPHLNENRIFAKWLQKRVVFAPQGSTVAATVGAVGPDTVRLKVSDGHGTGLLRVLAEDGVTLLGELPVTLDGGQRWRVVLAAEE